MGSHDDYSSRGDIAKLQICQFFPVNQMIEKSRIRETPNLSTDANSSTSSALQSPEVCQDYEEQNSEEVHLQSLDETEGQ